MFKSSSTTSEGVINDLFSYVTQDMVKNNVVPPGTGVTQPLKTISNADEFVSTLQSLYYEHSGRVGGKASDMNNTPAEDSYNQRRFDFLKESEGYSRTSYDDAGGRSVGMGFKMDAPGNKEQFLKVLGVNESFYNDVYEGKRMLSPVQIRALFDSAADEAEQFVNTKFKGTNLTEHQRLALMSLAYNNPSLIGPNLTSYIKSGDVKSASEEILHKSNAKRDRGIAGRRYREATMFVGGLSATDLPDPKEYLKAYS